MSTNIYEVVSEMALRSKRNQIADATIERGLLFLRMRMPGSALMAVQLGVDKIEGLGIGPYRYKSPSKKGHLRAVPNNNGVPGSDHHFFHED